MQSQGRYFGPKPSESAGGGGPAGAPTTTSTSGGGGLSDSGPGSSYSGPDLPDAYHGPPTDDTHGKLMPATLSTENWIKQHYPQFTDIGGYRQPDGFNEHSSGHALDVMLSGTQYQHGDAQIMPIIQDVFKNNPYVDYILWNQTQWNRDGTSSAMGVRGGGNDTDNHRDHFHIHTANRQAIARARQIVAQYGPLYGIEDPQRWVDTMISQSSTGPRGCSWRGAS
jgi:hypothetical protein